eukprot:gene69362-biopygen28413
MWAEWFSNSPTIVFLTISLTGKKNLSRTDWAIIASFFMCIVFGFLPIVPQPQSLAYVWVALSAIACVPVLSLPWYLSSPVLEAVVDSEQGTLNPVLASNSRQRQQYSLAYWMTFVCPLFPITYLLAATKAIGPGDSAGAFLLLTLLLKNYFAVNLAEAHTDAFLESEREIEKERQANESRTAFLKHLFHEVRTPLNSLSMGLELLSTRKNDDADRELLTMMTGASTFMANTLNDFLSMQQIEEGKMEL